MVHCLEHTSGIYGMYFEGLEDQFYIGKASSLSNRYSSHLSKLKYEKHPNYLLQKYYNLYGNPFIQVLETCSIYDLTDREVHWITEFNSFNSGLNLTPGGEGAATGEDHPNSLYLASTYASILLELAHTTKTAKEISIELGVSINVVRDISCMSTHSYLQDIYPQSYTLLKNKLGKRVSGSSCAADKGLILPKIIDPLGNIHEVLNINKFSQEHGLDRAALQKLLRYKAKSHLGWKRYE